ncbi:MAG: Gfo/Idh/MocA family oxidoreductase [Planctomycetaceae bacterium]
MLNGNLTRRDVLKKSTLLTASGIALNAVNSAISSMKSETVVIGLMGCQRGRKLIETFAKCPGVDLRYIAETDSERGAAGADLAVEHGFKRPQVVGDFRKILDDDSVDALICAAPNHWHGPATILACAAGKHVYVEKPCSHNPREGELMLEAARKHKRAVQVGTQRRSSAEITNAVRMLKEGAIGRVYSVNAVYTRWRDPIGHGEPAEVPANIDYELWQGPAPRLPYKDNYLHYDWHWFWHWGNGELGNNGVHGLDVCRWGLGVDYPTRVVSSGGRYCYNDDQQTPDTHIVAFEFPDKQMISWQGQNVNRFPSPYIVFRGEIGSLEIFSGCGFRVLNDDQEVIHEEERTEDVLASHLENFLTAIRANDPGC